MSNIIELRPPFTPALSGVAMERDSLRRCFEAACERIRFLELDNARLLAETRELRHKLGYAVAPTDNR